MSVICDNCMAWSHNWCHQRNELVLSNNAWARKCPYFWGHSNKPAPPVGDNPAPTEPPPVTEGKWLCPECAHANICRILLARSGEPRDKCGYYLPTEPPVTEWHKGEERPKDGDKGDLFLVTWPEGDVGLAIVSLDGVWKMLPTYPHTGVPGRWARIDWEGRWKA